MTSPIGRFTPYQHVAAVHAAHTAAAEQKQQVQQVQQQVQQRPAEPKPRAVESGTIVGDVPPAPTPQARELVAKAADVVKKMHDNNRELHFSTDETTNRVIIEVRDLDGNVLKTIPPKSALDILTGDIEL